MTLADKSLKIAGAAVACAVSVLAVAGAWSLTTRTTPVQPGVVYRENLVTGRAEFCSAAYGCAKVERKSFPGRRVAQG